MLPAQPQQPPSAPEEHTIVIGGTKGHVAEPISGRARQLYESFHWKMIPHCTGRYTYRDHATVSHLTPHQLLVLAKIPDAENLPCYSFQLPGRPDPVLVLPLDDQRRTGIITYVKQGHDNAVHYVHTLNSQSGFQRKLQAIGIHSL